MNDVILLKHRVNWGLNEEKVIKIARRILLERKFGFRVELSILFVGVLKARELNINYRKMDYIPQVLGFPNSKEVDGDGLVRLGDIVICTKKLKREVLLKENKGKDVYGILNDWIDHGIDNLLK